MGIINNKPTVTHSWPAASVNAKYDVQWFNRGSRGYLRQETDPPNRQFPYVGWKNVGYIEKVPSYVSSRTYQIGVGASYWFNRWMGDPFGGDIAPATNRSWGKMMERVKGDTSALAVAAAEGREVFEMVAKRTTGLYRAYKSLRKGNFRQFCKELSVDPKRKHRSLVRSGANEASGLWLEYWFGWSPTLQDFYSAALAMSSNPVLASVREHGTGMVELGPRSIGGASSRSRWNAVASGKCFVKQGATFKLENYNLFLANRLGLVNPALVAWELIPFSFVADWFTGFGTFIEGCSDLVGLSQHDPYSTSRLILKGSVSTYDSNDKLGSELRVGFWQNGHQRVTSLTRPVPVFPRLINFGHSKTRAATAVSLLTAIFLDGSLSKR